MVDIDTSLNLDPSNYVTGAETAIGVTDRLQRSVDSMSIVGNRVQRVLNQVTPTRASVVGLSAFTAAAIAQQSALHDLQSTQALTGQSTDLVRRNYNALARELPIGNTRARELAQTFNQVGVVGKGMEGRIGSLSKTVSQTAAAVGEAAPGIGRGLVQIQRALGDQNVDPTRLSKVSDALVQVSKNSGASATSVLELSRYIAPMARQAGIGETALFGMSASLSKMGDDGYQAANAVNKMLTDLNASVRDGSAEMSTYATIVGKTRSEFEALYKANPTEAVTEITEAIGRDPRTGSRALERIGLEGVRTQRIFAGLSQSGSLRSSISTAVDAYGNGASQRGADAAFHGVDASFAKLSASSEQLAQALGEPLLNPLGRFIDLLTKPVSGLAGAAGSGLGSGVITGLAYAGLAAYLGRRVAGFGMVTGAAGVAGTSGPIRSLTAAFARPGNWADRWSAPMTAMRDDGSIAGYNRSILGGALAFNRERSYGAALREDALRTSLGPQRFADLQATQAAAGNPVSRFVRTAAFWGSQGVLAAGNVNSSMQRQYLQPTGARTDPAWPQPGGAVRATGRATWSALTAQGSLAERLDNAGAALTSFRANVQASDGRLANFGRFVTGMTTPVTSTMRMSSSMGGGLLNALGGPLRSGLGFLGGAPGLALMGGLYGYSAYQSAQHSYSDEGDRIRNLSITSTLDDYRLAAGRATDATITLADQVEAAGRSIGRTVTRLDDARKVSPDDVAYAQQTANRKVHTYGDDPRAVAAQISAMSVTGLSPQDLQDVKVDLLRSHSQDFVNTVMRQVHGPAPDWMTSTQQAQNLAGTAPVSQDRAIIQGAAADTKDYSGGSWLSPRGFWNKSFRGESIASRLGYHGFQPGGRFNNPTLTKVASESLDAINNQIAQRYKAQYDEFGKDYARQTQLQGMNQAFNEVIKTGDLDMTAALSQRFSNALGAGNVTIRSGDVSAHGGFVQALAAKNHDFGKILAGNESGPTAISLTPGQGVAAQIQSSFIARQMAGFGTFGSFFSNLGPNADRTVNRAVAASVNSNNGDPAKMQAAVEAMVNAASAAGMSLDELASKSSAAANKLADATDPNYQLSEAVSQRAQQRIAGQAPFQTSTRTLEQRLRIANANAALTPTNTEQAQKVEQARSDQIDLTAQLVDTYKQRLMQQYQFQVASTRAWKDYHLQVEYADHDFGTMLDRAAQDYTTQRYRTERNYLEQTKRSTDDFRLSEHRSQDDFQRNVLRSQFDFRLQQYRAQRDFSIQMKRASEDAANSMYEPFKRIQTEAVWDGRNLLLNLQEQQRAMETQAANLKKARAAGLSNQTISALGLNQSQNAQQLDYLVGDLGSDRSLADQINKTVAARTKTGSQIYNDVSNKEVERAQEDFRRQLSDQQSDFNRGMSRQADDFSRTMSRSGADFKRQLLRGKHDLGVALSDMGVDYHRSIARAETDHGLQMARLQTGFELSMSRMKEDLALAQKEIAGSFEQIQQATMAAMTGATVNWGKILIDPLSGELKVLAALVPQFAGQANALGNALLSGDPGGAAYSKYRQGERDSENGVNSGLLGLLDPSGMTHKATGGRITGPGTGTSDSVRALLSNGEHVWTAREVANAGGHAAVEAMRAYFADGPRYAAGGRVSWGDPQDPDYAKKYLVTTHAGGLTFLVNRMVADRFVKLVGELEGENYHPHTIMGWARRPIAGTHTWSNHAYGAAIDIDPDLNPRYATGAGGRYALPTNSGVLAAQAGLFWGGQYRSSKDYMHFEALGAPATPGSGHAGPAGYSTFGSTYTTPPDPKRYLGHGLLGVLAYARDVRLWRAAQLSGGAGAAPDNASGNAALAKRMAQTYGGWGSGQEWNDLYWLWNQESGFKTHAGSPAAAYGIPQALPGSKMMVAGADWMDNPATQIRWGLNYIKARYHDPSGAVRHKHATRGQYGNAEGWYGEGGIAPGYPHTIGVGERGVQEAVIPLDRRGANVLAEAMSQYVNDTEARTMLASTGSRTYITYHADTYTYDQGTHIEGPVTVISSDPDDLARKLAAKQRRDNLTGARS